jgi:hypothetical protein
MKNQSRKAIGSTVPPVIIATHSSKDAESLGSTYVQRLPTGGIPAASLQSLTTFASNLVSDINEQQGLNCKSQDSCGISANRLIRRKSATKTMGYLDCRVYRETLRLYGKLRQDVYLEELP